MDSMDRVLSGPKTRSIQVQTDYRDSEAQTDPYSPQIKYFLGPLPEVMTITALCWGEWVGLGWVGLGWSELVGGSGLAAGGLLFQGIANLQ